jgi:MHS family alpha-ketoglutarate permease-like MFS transporter
MEETKAFVDQHTDVGSHGNLRELLNYPKELSTVVALTAGGTVFYYTFTVYMQKFLVNTTGFSKDDATVICVIALLVFMLIQPLYGLISDFVGRRFMLIAFGAGATIFTVPILSQLSQSQSMESAIASYNFWLLIGKRHRQSRIISGSYSRVGSRSALCAHSILVWGNGRISGIKYEKLRAPRMVRLLC